MKRRILLGFILFSLACTKEESNPPAEEIDCMGITSTYSADVKAIIDLSCAISGCHVNGFIRGDFTTYEGLKTEIDNGSVQLRTIEQRDMPPSNSSGPTSLTDAQIQLLHCWIEDGAPNN